MRTRSRRSAFCKLPLAALCVAAMVGCGAQAGREMQTDKKDVRPTSGLPACSRRLDLVREARIEPSRPAPDTLKSAFGTKQSFGIEENVAVLPQEDGRDGLFRIAYPEGSVNFSSAKKGRPLGGASFYAPFSDADVLCLHYKVRFPENFSFVKGGKLPGLYAGKAPSGGEEVTDDNGWTVRLMWREDGQGELYEYVVNKKKEYGLSVGRGAFTFPRGRWAEVDLEVVVNREGERDGIARLWIDGEPVIEQRGIVYTEEHQNDAGLMFSTFFGGNDESWASPKDQHVDFADFRMYAGERP